MKNLFLIFTFLLCTSLSAQYRGTRQNGTLITTEDYVTNSPGSSISNSRLIARYKDSTDFSLYYNNLKFSKYGISRNDGTPNTILWTDNDGNIKKSNIPVWISTELDPVWISDKSNYYTKTLADARYLQSFTESDPIWAGVSSLYRTKNQNDLLYEPAFNKNTAFNKNFGSLTGTIAEGNDARILNGQTSFGWGNHASAGYILTSNFNSTFDTRLSTKSTSDITEGSNLYHTDLRSRNVISLTNIGQTGNSSYNSTTGVFNIPNYTVTPGTGISVSTNVITNTAPDQTVALIGSNGITTSGTYPNFTVAKTKRQETLTVSTNASGIATFTFANTYSVAPNIQYQMGNGATVKETIIPNSAPTTTGSVYLVQVRNDALGLLPTYANVSGREVNILVTEK